MSQDREFWLQIRAAKLRIADNLQQQRAAVLEEVAAIEREWDIEPRDKSKRHEITLADLEGIGITGDLARSKLNAIADAKREVKERSSPIASE